ncbi:MAG: hypothetical protein NT090_02750 [Acidobacteria bacterium]|nr:hypothetical protein [Acidobacteriota bacterium]
MDGTRSDEERLNMTLGFRYLILCIVLCLLSTHSASGKDKQKRTVTFNIPNPKCFSITPRLEKLYDKRFGYDLPYLTGTVVNNCGTTVNVKLTFTYYGKDCLLCRKIILLDRKESIKPDLFDGDTWVLEEDTSHEWAREGKIVPIGIVTLVDIDVAYETSLVSRPRKRFDK